MILPMQRQFFRIRLTLEQQLDPATLSWMEDLIVTYGENSTNLDGMLPDQTRLFGLINRVRDLGLHIVSLQVEREDTQRSQN